MALPQGIEGVGALIGREVLSAIRQALIALFALAVGDFMIQRQLMLRDLKMSFQEQKDEHKETMGNPEVKQHIRQIGHEILSGEPRAKDPLEDSNALIVNPTHLAVGLRYVKDESKLPQIRVKAADEAAMNLIEIAQDKKVPVVRHIWLARTLYQHNEGEPIPREAFTAVAAVYRMLHQLDQTLASEKAPTPGDPPFDSPAPGAEPPPKDQG
jgi:type III secretion protein U